MIDIAHLNTEVFERLSIVEPTAQQINLVTAVLNSLLEKPKMRANKFLSKREKSCLYLLAQENSLEEISVIMAIKRTTVVTFVRRIKSKLQCNTLAQAVYEGLLQENTPN